MSTALTSTSIRLEIQKIKELPPLPVIAQQLLKTINNENSSIDEIARVIQSDPILTSRILGLANSAFFGFPRGLYNLSEAIVNVLGLDLVKALGLTMVMGGVFDVRSCRQFDIVRHWSHAFMTAELSTRLSTLVTFKTRKTLDNQLFLYGLLHNFGILILVNRFPRLMTDIFAIARKHPERRLIYTERQLLDMDHHQAGSWLAQKWQLPEDVSTVIEQHHYPEYRGEYWQEALVVGFASRMARNWILGTDILVPDDEAIAMLQLDRKRLPGVAEKCRGKLDGINNIAREMAA